MTNQIKKLLADNDGKLPEYGWPGGYPIFYLDREDSTLCAECATKSTDEDEMPQFKPVAFDINYEDAGMYCEQCNKMIDCAYPQESKEED